MATLVSVLVLHYCLISLPFSQYPADFATNSTTTLASVPKLLCEQPLVALALNATNVHIQNSLGTQARWWVIVDYHDCKS